MTLRLNRFDAGFLGVGAALCLFAAIAVTRRDSISMLVIAGIGGLAILLVFYRLGFRTLLAWVILTGLAFPVLSIGATDTPISFDRLVIGGMASWLVLQVDTRKWAPEAKWFGLALVWLALAYGIRAGLTENFGAATPTGGNARSFALNTWIDAIVLPVILYFVVARLADTVERCRQLTGAMAIAGASLGAIGLAEKVYGFELASLSGGSLRVDSAVDSVRIAGTYSVPETYALVLLMCLAGTLWWTMERGRGRRGWGTTAIALELAGLAVTLFRAAWLGAVIIFVIGLGLRPGRGWRLGAIAIGAGAVLTLGFLALGSNAAFQERIRNTDNISSRFATYEQSVRMFGDHPLTGVGVQQFQNAQRYTPVTVVDNVEAATSAHNSFLSLLTEQGLLGFAPLVACVFAVWKLLAALRWWALERADILLWACLVGAALAYLVMSLTLTMLPYGPSNAFFIVLLGMAAGRLSATTRFAAAFRAANR